MSDANHPLADFAGVARLFPLPNLVLFPHVMQPLHIFEPRYRQMTTEALADDRLIAPVLMCPGWEGSYDGNPPVHSIACIGRIVADQVLEDGRFNLLLRGIRRVRIVEELQTTKLYRSANVELLDDCGCPEATTARRYRKQLKLGVVEWFAEQPAVLDQFRKLLHSDLPLGILADIIAFALPLTVEVKQQLLQQLDVEARIACLLKHMNKDASQETPPPSDRTFPPEFSTN